MLATSIVTREQRALQLTKYAVLKCLPTIMQRLLNAKNAIAAAAAAGRIQAAHARGCSLRIAARTGAPEIRSRGHPK